jgi:peptidyl-prolyl cis-trans isomerase A (cyclophilin A)
MRCFPIFAAACLAVATAEAALEADLTTTAGIVTVELDFVRAPRAVANFISLAEGTRRWIDPSTGAVSDDRYYDGTVFHAVVNQPGDRRASGGSRDGSGADGPGFTILDDLDPALVHQPYVMAFESSGPNSGGGRFHLTGSDPMPARDGRDIVFGSVTSASGRETVDQILAAAPGTVTLLSVSFRRTDPAAAAFDALDVPLPTVETPPGGPRVSPAGIGFDFVRPPGASTLRASASSDLAQWQPVLERFRGIDDPSPPAPEPVETFEAPTRFYHFAAVSHPAAGGCAGFAHRTLRIETPGTGEIIYSFDATGLAGTYLNVPIPGFPLTFSGPFTVLPELPAKYDAYRFSVLIHAEGLGGSPRNWIRGGYDSVGGTTVTGRHVTAFFDASMNPVFEDSGPLEIDRP